MDKVYNWYIMNKKVNPKDKEVNIFLLVKSASSDYYLLIYIYYSDSVKKQLLKRNSRAPPKETMTQTPYIHDDKALLSYRTDNNHVADSIASQSQISLMTKQARPVSPVHLPNVSHKLPNNLQQSTSTIDKRTLSRQSKKNYEKIEAEYEASK